MQVLINPESPPLISPEFPDTSIPELTSTASRLVATPFRSTSPSLKTPSVKDKLLPSAEVLQIKAPRMLRSDVANGLVSEEEIRKGHSLRPSNDPMWAIDMDYLRYLRGQLGLSPVRPQNSGTVYSPAEQSITSNSLEYIPQASPEHFRTKSVITQVCSDDPYLQQRGLEMLTLYSDLALQFDGSKARMLYFDFSKDAIAKGTARISNCHTPITTLYKKSNTYVCFMADVSTVFNEDQYTCEPFIIVSEATLGRQIFDEVNDTGQYADVSFETHSATLHGGTRIDIAELFLVKSISI